MNKVDLVNALHSVLGGTRVSAENAMEALIDTITGSLKKSEQLAQLGIHAQERRSKSQLCAFLNSDPQRRLRML